MVTNRDRALDSPQQNGSSKVVHFCSFLSYIPIYCRQGVLETKKQKNCNKPKPQDLFRLCFGLFRETNNNKFLFVSACFSVSNLYQNNRNKQNCFEKTETTLNFLKNTKICSLSNCFGQSSVCFSSIETSKLSVSEQKRNNQNKYFVLIVPKLVSSSFCCFESKLVSKDTLIVGRFIGQDGYQDQH